MTSQTSARFTAIAKYFEPQLLALEHALKTDYLGDDTRAACQLAATMEGEPVFLATAALDIEIRRKTLQEWRARVIQLWLGKNQVLFDFVTRLPEPKANRIRSGEMELVELDGIINADFEERENKRQAERNRSKAALNEVIRDCLADCSGEETGRVMPGHLTIVEDGSIRLFRRRANAIAFGRESGLRFLEMPISSENAGIHPPAEPV